MVEAKPRPDSSRRWRRRESNPRNIPAALTGSIRMAPVPCPVLLRLLESRGSPTTGSLRFHMERYQTYEYVPRPAANLALTDIRHNAAAKEAVDGERSA